MLKIKNNDKPKSLKVANYLDSELMMLSHFQTFVILESLLRPKTNTMKSPFLQMYWRYKIGAVDCTCGCRNWVGVQQHGANC